LGTAKLYPGRRLWPLTMLFTVPKKHRHPGGFGLSVVLHGGLISAMAFGPGDGARSPKPPEEHKYSVLLLRLQDFPRTERSEEKEQKPASGQASAVGAASHTAAKYSLEGPRAAAEPNPAAADGEPAADHRSPFVLPPTRKPDPVKQTLVQFDIPPAIQLKGEVPLPTALIWPDRMPPIRKTFVAPVAQQKPKPIVAMPAAPELSAPNKEIMVADLKVAASPINAHKAFLMPAKTAPIKGTGAQPVVEPPQIAAAHDLSDTSVTALISLPDAPVRSAQVVVVPPANQIAAAGAPGGTGSGIGAGKRGEGLGGGNQTGIQNQASGGAAGPGDVRSRGAGARGDGSDGASSSGASSDGSKSGAPSSGAVSSGAVSSGAVSSGGGALRAGITPGRGGLGSPGDGAAPDNGASGKYGRGVGGDGDLPLVGMTRLTMPKEGKFGVVVAGTSAAAPYAESIGALSGKMVYSVFLDVGLRKKWLLQYCLPRAEEQKSGVRGRAEPLEAPWPYLVARPNKPGTSSPDYVVVHGTITTDGRFDKLALVFPRELDKTDNLMRSLTEWTFRPASRNGVPADVEILLIVPRQPD
jgi:hypothetical protein